MLTLEKCAISFSSGRAGIRYASRPSLNLCGSASLASFWHCAGAEQKLRAGGGPVELRRAAVPHARQLLPLQVRSSVLVFSFYYTHTHTHHARQLLPLQVSEIHKQFVINESNNGGRAHSHCGRENRGTQSVRGTSSHFSLLLTFYFFLLLTSSYFLLLLTSHFSQIGRAHV